MGVFRYVFLLFLGLLVAGCMGQPVVKKVVPQAVQQPNYSSSMVSYQLPDAVVKDQDGRQIFLPQLLKYSEPYALNFFFTSCTQVCPVTTATFAKVQQELGADAQKLQLISISIDPEHDTPEVLKAYAQKNGAGGNWLFLTGEQATVTALQRSLDGYVADKMNHQAFTLIKAPGQEKWLRVDGLASSTELVAEYKRLMGQ